MYALKNSAYLCTKKISALCIYFLNYAKLKKINKIKKIQVFSKDDYLIKK